MSDSGEDVGAPIVIDNGSDTTKAGFGGDDAPRSVFPTLVGRPRIGTTDMASGQKKDAFVGDDAKANRATCGLRYPIEYGQVTNWDDMEKIWHHAFYNELKTDPSDSCVTLTEAVLTPKANREKMTQIMMETFGCEGFFVQSQPVLSLFASGRTTGLVVDSGHAVTQVVPVYEGYALPHAIPRPTLCPSGNDLTYNLENLLQKSGVAMPAGGGRIENRELMRDIKEKMCYVALDPEAEELAHRQSEEMVDSLAQVPSSVMPMDLVDHCVNFMGAPKNYVLPDGAKISVGAASFRCPEALFNPRLMGTEVPGLHELIFDCIQKCDCDIRNDFYANIVLSGGSTLFKGFPERLAGELEKIAHSLKVKVIAPPRRKYSVWIGASTLSNLSSFKEMWITKAEYDDSGPGLVHRKCY